MDSDLEKAQTSEPCYKHSHNDILLLITDKNYDTGNDADGDDGNDGNDGDGNDDDDDDNDPDYQKLSTQQMRRLGRPQPQTAQTTAQVQPSLQGSS